VVCAWFALLPAWRPSPDTSLDIKHTPALLFVQVEFRNGGVLDWFAAGTTFEVRWTWRWRDIPTSIPGAAQAVPFRSLIKAGPCFERIFEALKNASRKLIHSGAAARRNMRK